MKKNLTSLLAMDLERMYNNQSNEMPNNRFSINLAILNYFIISRSFRSIFFYRILRIYFLNKKNTRRSFFLILSRIFNCILIPYSASIGVALLLGPPDCTVIHYKCVMGDNVTIMQGVTIGGNMGKTKNGVEAPIIGNGVFIGPGAKILGPITIGDNSIIGANAVVINDIPKNSLAAGVPAKVIKNINKPFIEIQNEWKNHLRQTK